MKIQFDGFKRLRHTGCNASGRVVAFLGPNEAGKSSVLQGLAWLSDRSGEEIPDEYRARSVGVDADDTVVTVVFSVDTADLERIDSSRADQSPSELRLEKLADGRRQFTLTPRPRRPTGVFDEALAAASDVRSKMTDVSSEAGEFVATALDELIQLLGRPDRATRITWNDRLTDLETTVRGGLGSEASQDEEGDVGVSDGGGEDENTQGSCDNFGSSGLSDLTNVLAEKLESLRLELAKPDPHLEIGLQLLNHSPEFVLFDEADRELRSWYDLSSDQVQNSTPRALANLLSIAGTSPADLLEVQQRQRISEIQTREKKCNESLRAVLDETWGQSNLSVRINLEGTRVQVLIEERDAGGGIISLGERSDGLRLYVALMCFLATRHENRPTILMIDEAETHLHIDAQADLVRTFYKMGAVDQVIYTTHSPGCLPTDLGTGVRLVEPDRESSETSHLRNNFWRNDIPGYSPLLYAMGAGAAAFSACRNAVLCEGAADMILIPTLLKIATGSDQLDYQIAPGLSNMRPEQVSETESIGANVVYLTDGDEGGRALRKMLIRAGVPEDRILSLPDGFASEDFIEPDPYLSVVRSVMKPSPDSPMFPDPSSLTEGATIASQLARWAEVNSIELPGKVAIAANLVERIVAADIKESAVPDLQSLHTRIVEALARK